jgi:3-methyladenine DNA glycosylase/8-oxoguanine DNA glycosylase
MQDRECENRNYQLMVVIQFEENADMNKKSAKKNDIEAALSSADPKLGKLIKIVMSKIGKPPPPFSKASPFEALLRAIIYQRMAGKSAATIYKRLQLLVKGAGSKKISALAEPYRSIASMYLWNAVKLKITPDDLN